MTPGRTSWGLEALGSARMATSNAPSTLERRRRDIHKSFSFLKYIFGFSKKKTTRRDKGAAISVGRVGGGLKLVFEGEGGKVAVHRRGLRLVLGPLLLGRFNGFLLSSSWGSPSFLTAGACR